MTQYTLIIPFVTIYDKKIKQAPCPLKFEHCKIAGVGFVIFKGKHVYIQENKVRFHRYDGSESTYGILDGNNIFLAGTCTPEKFESSLKHFLSINPHFVAEQVAEWNAAIAA